MTQSINQLNHSNNRRGQTWSPMPIGEASEEVGELRHLCQLLADRVAIDTLPRKDKPSAEQLARTEALMAGAVPAGLLPAMPRDGRWQCPRPPLRHQRYAHRGH